MRHRIGAAEAPRRQGATRLRQASAPTFAFGERRERRWATGS